MIANARKANAGVVLVHGAFVDGSGWEGVYRILKKDGHEVSVVQIPTVSLADDVAATTREIDAHAEPVILVGHSYAGVVITEAGNNPKVAGLVFVAAFAPDSGSRCRRSSRNRCPVRPWLPSCRHKTGFSC